MAPSLRKQLTLWMPLLLPLFLWAQQKGHQLSFSTPDKMQYLLYSPPQAANGNEKRLPLLVFLHGGGESGQDLELVKKNGPPKLVEAGQDFPCFILSPQNPHVRGFWEEHQVAELIDSITARYPIDPNRIYLTGLSRGGYGVWQLAMLYPDRFAAVVPICGATALPYAGWVPDLPLWVFHGADDPVIPVSESAEMVHALREKGRKPRFTIYANTGHNSWEKAYSEPVLWEWLLDQQRPTAPFSTRPSLPADSLRRALEQMYGLDQGLREQVSQMNPYDAALVAKLNRTDSLNQVAVREILATHGWLPQSAVGEKAASALYLIVQHADLALMEQYFPQFQQLANMGEAKRTNLATMDDRMRMYRHEKQLYGTQAKGRLNKDGSYESFIWPIEQPESVNERREAMGFDLSVEENAARLNATYRPKERLPKRK